jgi:DNA-binding NarL/FixJ family response regulator
LICVRSRIPRRSGFNDIEIYGYATDAKLYLEKALNNSAPMPDAILIDLNLSKEDGFELLRFRNGNPAVMAVPLIVWTAENERYREVSDAFDVHRTVLKSDDIHVLMETLESIVAGFGGFADSAVG